MRRWRVGLGAALFVSSIVAAACDGEPQTSDLTLPTTVGGDAGGGGGGPSIDVDGAAIKIKIAPDAATLTASGPGQTQKFQVFVGDSTSPIAASSVKWATDVAAIGTIAADGVFTATGNLGGVTRVSATVGATTVSTNFTVHLSLAANAAKLDAAAQAKLRAGGAGDPAYRWLYPYDKTVFPRGLTGPTLQLGGAAPDAYRVHVKSQYLDYEGFYPGTNARIDFDPELWKTLTNTATANDPLVVDVTKIAGGVAVGPISESWTIAQGTLTGVVYYDSYDSALGGNTGTILRIKPGKNAEVFIGGTSGTCTVCHAVSANGTTLVTARTDAATGAAYDVAINQPAKLAHLEPDTKMSWGALYPDGSIMMTHDGPNYPAGPARTPDVAPSHLMDPRTGATIPAPGWDGVVTKAMMPIFSPDGKRIAFNHYDKGAGHTLAFMDVTNAGKTYSGTPIDIASDAAAFLGWPSFEPDSNWLLYAGYDQSDFATLHGAHADVSIAHLPSKTTAKLDRLNGIDGGNVYLPYGAAEAHLNYEPTILPEPVGGYQWVIFTSRRKYGNIATVDDQNDSQRMKLWVAALDVETPEHPHTAAYDASHPAFLLPGQEAGSGSLRAFWALDACKQSGNSCATGDDCCSGFCREGSDGKLACVPPPPDCSPGGAVCTKDADCCTGSGLQCLAGTCGSIR